MGSQDALFMPQIFRKDNPIVLACRRDLALFIGVRLVYSQYDYPPGQCLVRYNTGANAGLFDRWSNASGASYDSPVILFDQVTNPAQQENSAGGTLTGVSGSTLARALAKAVVYTTQLTDYNAGFATAIGAITRTDSGGNQLTTF